ncbi:MAG: FKBP-type peptidyl-prolyl cis-trans isomerase [Verrucomicrobiae bacterium]|nr:FKBP-type peptidyl-prolyl cis-trans isomerase [Verrucomicrobiae bacterium]
MKSLPFAVLAAATVVGLPTLIAQPASDAAEFRDRLSYALGADIGNNLKRQEIDVDPKRVAEGLTDAVAGKSAMTPDQIRDIMNEFRSQMMARMQAKQADEGKKNRADGEAFLAQNRKKEGVKATASGLQYQVLKSGNGKTPAATDVVKVHYHGTLTDGTVFDSSIDRGEPATFPVNGVIPGWTEALQLMKVGDEWQLAIPSDLAYGEQGAGGDIGPNSVLLFKVQLLGIEPGDR